MIGHTCCAAEYPRRGTWKIASCVSPCLTAADLYNCLDDLHDVQISGLTSDEYQWDPDQRHWPWDTIAIPTVVLELNGRRYARPGSPWVNQQVFSGLVQQWFRFRPEIQSAVMRFVNDRLNGRMS